MDTSEMRGLRLDIYSTGRGNASNGGVSSRCTEVCVVGVVNELSGKRGEIRMFKAIEDRVPDRPREAFGSTPEVPAAVIVRRRRGTEILLHVEPLIEPEERTGTPFMFGGCYVGTSDSRLRRLVGEGAFYGALSLHDRTETWDQYQSYSD